MLNPKGSARRLSVVFLLCGVTVLWAAQKKTPAQRSAATPSPGPAPIAVHEYQLEGVDLALMEVTRTAPEVVTVKWEYRNKTKEPQKLATVSHGWSDPYRLCWDSYLLGADGKTQFPVMKDSKGYPIAAVHGQPVQPIVVAPGKTLKTWAKYAVPASTRSVTIVITGADPFENVAVKEPASQQ